MGGLKDLLRLIGDGEITAEEAVPEFRSLLKSGKPSTTEDTWGRMAGVVDERDATDTFTEVSSAWIAGRITREQYDLLRAAVAGSPAEQLVRRARAFATDAHLGQEDKAGRSYISHPERVAARVESFGPEFVAVAWLHDVVEDCGITADELLAYGFPPDVVEGVRSVSKERGESHVDAVLRACLDPIGIVVKAADVADNSDPARLALLPPALQVTLGEKYARARQILDDSGGPSFGEGSR